MILNTAAYTGLCKIARKTGMDCWFNIIAKNGEDMVFDSENNKIISLQSALEDFVDGVIDPPEEYGLAPCQIREVKKVFDTYGVIPMCDWERRIGADIV